MLRLPGDSLRSPPLPGRHARAKVRPHRPLLRRVLLALALRAPLVEVLASLALAGCAACGHRLGPSRQHSVRHRCRLRRAPLAALVRALLRSTPALRSAPRRAPTATQSPWRLPLRRLRRRRFSEHRCCRFGRPDRPGRPWVPHPTHSKCWMCHARACHALSATSAAFGRPALVGPSVCSGEDLLSYWNRMCFSGGRSRSIHPGFLEHTRISPEHTANRTRAYSRIARSTRLNVRHRGRRRVDFGARAGRRRSRSKLPAARFFVSALRRERPSRRSVRGEDRPGRA